MTIDEHIDSIRNGWARERPDFPVRSVAVTSMIWRLARMLTAERSRVLRVLEMDQAMLDLLACLRRTGAPFVLTPGDLSQRCGVSASAISQRLSRAVDLGWVTREPDPGDGRGVRVRLTDAGRTAVDHVAGEVLRHDDDLVSTLTDDDLQRLETELRELIGSVERRQADLHDQPGT